MSRPQNSLSIGNRPFTPKTPFTAIATLGGLVIMRQGGPVQFHVAAGNWRNAGRGILVGLVVGLPLAALNAFALQLTQAQPIQWQNLLAAMMDALQPAIVEEAIYRFALWSFWWLFLRKSLPGHAVWLAGLLAMLVHNFSHFDNLFIQSPLAALGMGAVLALVWGVPSDAEVSNPLLPSTGFRMSPVFWRVGVYYCPCWPSLLSARR